MGENNFGKEAASALAKALMHNNTLIELGYNGKIMANVVKMKMKNGLLWGITEVGESAFGGMCVRVQRLVDRHHFVLISSHLVYTHHHHTHGRLAKNLIGDEGATTLAEALKHNSTLTTLMCDDEMRVG